MPLCSVSDCASPDLYFRLGLGARSSSDTLLALRNLSLGGPPLSGLFFFSGRRADARPDAALDCQSPHQGRGAADGGQRRETAEAEVEATRPYLGGYPTQLTSRHCDPGTG
jgi:hypothetical protein